MEDYSSLLASSADNTHTQILIVPPAIVAFIASACISKSDLGLSRVERWKKGVTKNQVSTFVYYANQSKIINFS